MNSQIDNPNCEKITTHKTCNNPQCCMKYESLKTAYLIQQGQLLKSREIVRELKNKLDIINQTKGE